MQQVHIFEGNKISTIIKTALLASSTVFSINNLWAQELSDNKANTEVDEVITVTSRNRVETLQEVPVTVAAFTEKKIEQAGIERAADFIQLTPNVTFVSSESAGVNFMSIRGVSQVRNGESPVAVVVDGVLLTDPGQFDQELFDVQRIEVLKGPQGALYGRNAIGGAINITTREASDELEGKIKIGAGNGNRLRVQGGVSIPLSDSAALRLTGNRTDFDGLIDNVYLNQKADPYEDTSFRGRLYWEATDNLEVDFRAGISRTEGGALNFILQEDCGETNGCFSGDGQFVTNAADDTSTPITASRIGTNQRDIDTISLKMDYELEFAEFTSITNWTDQEEFYAADAYPYDCGPLCDASELRIFNTAFGAIPLDSNQLVKVITEVETLSQEFRLTSTGEDPLRWIVGAYYLETERLRGLPTELDSGQAFNREFFNDDTIFGFADDNDNTAYALFGQLNYDVNDKVETSFALRYDRDEREQVDIAPAQFSATSGQIRSKTFSELQPKLTVRYLPNDDVNLFITASRGFRSGGFNQNGIGAAAAAAGINGVFDDYEKEVSTNFEFGFKTQHLDGDVKVGGSLFYGELENQHFFQFIGAINAQLINNVDEVEIRGVELDLQYRATRDLELYAAYGLTDTEITDYAVDASHVGNYAPYVARTTFNAGIQYTPQLTDSMDGLFRLDYERRGRQFWDTANSSARSPLNLINARIGVDSVDGWTVAIWARNLTDKRYNEEYVIGGIAQIAIPRTYGIDFNYEF